MGCVGEAESLQASTSNGNKYKLPTTLLDGCGAVNHALVPKKLRSAIKKRVRESINSSLPIPKKKRHIQNGAEAIRKDGAKKSKPHPKKKGHITKDEEEVVETLFALAGMFSDPKLDDESPETKSSAITEDTGIPSPKEECGNISSKVTNEDSLHCSNLVDSTAQVIKLQSIANARQSNENQLIDHMVEKGKRVWTLGRAPNGDMATDLEQATASGIKRGKNSNPVHDKYIGSILSPSFSVAGALSTNGQGSCQRLPTWFERTNLASQPHELEKSITTGKYTGSKNSWKRCSAQVYICRLIKVLKISEERKEGLLLEKPIVGSTNQMTGNIGVLSFNGFSVKDSADHGETSAKQGNDFLSLGTGFSGMDDSDAPKPYNVSQNRVPMLFSVPQNGYSSSFNGHNSALAAQQVQIPQHLSSRFTARMGQQLESLHQKWAATQYSNNNNKNNNYNSDGGLISPFLPEWKNGYAGRDAPSMVNYAHTLFPHMHAALGSKYQQFSHHQQQQLMAINSSSLPLSNIQKHQHLPFGFERNGAPSYNEKMSQLQLPCNQHL